MNNSTQPFIGPDRLTFVFLVIVYRLLLDTAYYFYISPIYSYMGFVFDLASPPYVMYSYILVLTTACFVPLDTRKPSKFIAGFLYLVLYISASSLMAYGNFPIIPFLWLTLAFIALFLLCEMPIRIYHPFIITKNNIYLPVVVVTLYILGILLLLSQFGLRLSPADFEVYTARGEFSKYAVEQSRAAGYATIWMGSIIIPLIAAWSIIHRKILFIVIAVLSQFYIFMLGGHKSLLLAPLLVLWILIGIRYYQKRLLHYSVASFIGLTAVSVAIDYFSGNPIPYANAYLTQRIFYTPSLLYYYYLDFFSHHPHTFLSHSIALNWLIDYPFALPVPNMIGQEFFFSSEASANANMWADAYASFGVYGIFLFTGLLWLLTKLIDVISEDKNKYLVYAVMIMPLFALTNTGLLTTLSTHGMLLALVIIMLMTKPQQANSSA